MTAADRTRETVSLENYEPLPEGAFQYPVEFIEEWGAIKLREDENEVLTGITGTTGEETKNRISRFHKKPVRFLIIDRAELSAYLGNKMGEPDREEKKEAAADTRVLLDKLANDAPIINLVNSICIDGIRSGASDIHLEAGMGKARVRYRLDGVLKTVRTIETGRFPAISSRIKIMANLNILERRQPQDGRITVSLGKEDVDFRVSIVPVAGGESIVLRILGKKANAGDLSELGFEQHQLGVLRNLLHRSHGLILITGPTGSGKTTTLNTMLREITSDTLKIITIEDPVEFLVEGLNQIQTNERIGLGFETLLRRVLRQDPNVIMIGEIRDAATAEIALRSALTGHLVLSTLHTNDAVSVIPRLINMGIEPYLIASVLRGAAAQRLVRKICPRCKEPEEPGAEIVRLFKNAEIPLHTLYRGRGCAACDHTGFSGRTVIAELFEGDPELEELIIKRENLNALRTYLRGRGVQSLTREGLRKAAEGITTISEIERELILSEGEL
jgi:type II secretory ATPase GspE/PulE/Tfp pilus assembly ATPase PilB-like protein